MFDDIDVKSVSKYAAGKYEILTTMNISGSCVIHIVIVLSCVFPFHRSDIYRSSQNHLKIEGKSVSKVKVVSANADIILVAINKRSDTNINEGN